MLEIKQKMDLFAELYTVTLIPYAGFLPDREADVGPLRQTVVGSDREAAVGRETAGSAREIVGFTCHFG